MKAQTQAHTLQAGQVLTLAGRQAGHLVVAEGEVLVHAPARWLGARVVLPAPRRVAAPARIEAGDVAAVTAPRGARVVIEQVPALWPAFKAALLGGCAAPLRRRVLGF